MRALLLDRAVLVLTSSSIGLMAIGLVLWRASLLPIVWPLIAESPAPSQVQPLEEVVTPQADYSPAWKKPLFSPQRQADPVLDTVQPGSPGMDSFTVTGIVLTDTLRVAMLRQGGEPPLKVREGDQLPNGWTVAEILGRHVLFTQGNREQTLWLSGAQPQG